MLQIPDLDDMLVNVRVPEAFVDYLEKGGSKRKKATIKVDAFQSRLLKGHVKFVDTVASTQDWFAADVKVYKTLVAIDISYKLTEESLKALKHDSVPHPRSIGGTIAVGFLASPIGQRPFMAALGQMAGEPVPESVRSKLEDLRDREFASRKTFLTELDKVLSKEELAQFKAVILKHAKDNSAPSLKPGMSAEVTITAAQSDGPVLVVPVQSVIGTINMGADRKVFVVGADGHPVLRDIKVGMSNERMVEVKSGLSEGERVVENPRPLLGENSEMRPAKAGKELGAPGGSSDKGKAPGGKGAPDGKKGGGFPGGGQPKGPDAGQKGTANPGVGFLTPLHVPTLDRQWLARREEHAA